MAISFSSRVRVPRDILITKVGGESVILNLRSERYFGLDDTGTEMWAALSDSESIEAAYRELLQKYDVETDLLRRDLEALVEKLLEQGLIEISDE
ncbi:MAG: hypothetical protein AUG51_10310 [Acidobacteria bacterium 13_1_20CM_3_53_8]|nr:MAG: hypothetical protein AUG51_10310 [Acidobacteria bacterium 13_1_20CM_3_53_8]